MAKVVIKDSTMPKVKVKPSKTKKIDPAVVAKALGAEIVTPKKKSKKAKNEAPKYDPKFYYEDGWPSTTRQS